MTSNGDRYLSSSLGFLTGIYFGLKIFGALAAPNTMIKFPDSMGLLTYESRLPNKSDRMAGTERVSRWDGF